MSDVVPESGTDFEIGSVRGTIQLSEPGKWEEFLGDGDRSFRRIGDSGWTVLITLSHEVSSFEGDVSLRWIDSEGAEHLFSSDSRHDFSNVWLGHAESEPETIRIRVHPDQARVRFPLPETPALPVANGGLRNVFGAEIPFIQISDEMAFYEVITQTTRLPLREVDGNVQDPVFPPGYFPREFINTTPRQLLEEWRRHAPGRTWVDNENLRIVRESKPPPGFWERNWNHFKDLF